MGLEQLLCSLSPGVTVHTQPSGDAVLRLAREGRYAALPSSLWRVIARMDGTRPLSELVKDVLKEEHAPPLRALLDTVTQLRREGFLQPPSDEKPQHARHPLVAGLHPALPASVRGFREPRALLWAAGSAVIAASTLALVTTETQGLPQLPGALLLWLAGCAVLSLLGLGAWLGLTLLGTRPWVVGVGLMGPFPSLRADARDAQVVGPMGPAVVGLAEILLLSSGVMLAALARHLADGPVTTSFWFASLGVMLWVLRPLGDSPLVRVGRGFGGASLWLDGRAYLVRRFFRRVTTSSTFEHEGRILAAGLWHLAWAWLCLKGLGALLDAGLLQSLLRALDGESEGVVLLGVLAVGLAAVVVVPIWIAARGAVMRLRESRRPSSRSLEASEMQSALDALRGAPLFASLPVHTLEAMAARARLCSVKSGSFAVRQGESGGEFFIVRSGALHVVKELESGRRETVAQLSQGDGFGELALFGDGRRQATVRAVSDVTLVALDKDALAGALAATGVDARDVTRWLTLTRELRRSPLFAGMSASEVARFIRQARPEHLSRGTVLIREGDDGDRFYVCVAGKLGVTQGDRALAELGPGSYVGEMALLSGGPRVATVTALDETDVLSLDRATFLSTLASDFHFAITVSEEGARRRSGVDA